MGLVTVNIIRLCQIIKSRGAKGKSFCMLGRQSMLTELPEIIYLFNKMDIEYDKVLLEKMKREEKIDTYMFFKLLGFEDVHALDFTEDDGADIIFDLNEDSVPVDLYGRFDYVLDGGTLEHVFNISQAMKNVSQMVKRGGYIIHLSPTGGYIDHGFFSFSPTFFNDFYTQNGYLIEILDMGFYYDKNDYCEWMATYSMDCRLFGGFEEINNYIRLMLNTNEIGRIMLWCVAQKKEIKEEIYPIQLEYDISRKQALKENTEVEKGVIDFEKLMLHIETNKNKKIALFGSGYICNLIINQLYKYDLQESIQFILDNNVEKAGNQLRGYIVLCPTEKRISMVDEIIICSTKYCEQIYANLREHYANAVECIKITDFYKY